MLDARLNRMTIDAPPRVADERAARLNLALADLVAARRERMLGSVTVRMASPADAAALDRLAALDSARAPQLPALLAELGGQAVAALSLLDGAVVSDPFTPTTELVALLELRARQLQHADAALGRFRSKRRLLRRFRRVAASVRA